MARAGWRRRWIKFFPQECVDGSIRYQLEADERGTWYDLLNFCGLCSNDGVIADRDNRAFPHQFIANRLNISLELLERTLKKCEDEGRISEDNGGIKITNWRVYQSEYERQKPFRQLKQEKDKDYFTAGKYGKLVCTEPPQDKDKTEPGSSGGNKPIVD